MDNIEELLNKGVIVELLDGEVIEGILMDIQNVDNYEDMIFYRKIQIRIDYDDYRIIYENEIDTICELK